MARAKSKLAAHYKASRSSEAIPEGRKRGGTPLAGKSHADESVWREMLTVETENVDQKGVVGGAARY